MSGNLKSFIQKVCQECGTDQGRLMDVTRAVQRECGGITSEAIDLIAQELSMPRVEVESCVSFYSFFSQEKKGAIVIRVCNDIIDIMYGAEKVAQAFSDALGIAMGETTADGKFTLEYTPCIGMSDQAPAAMINDVIMTHLDSEKVREIVAALQKGRKPEDLVTRVGDGNNGSDLIRAMVDNNIRRKGPVVLDAFESGTALQEALAMTPAEVIRDIKTSRLRGRGGAGFPTGMKWDFTRRADGDRRYVLCNADEGEPGTFKDRVVLTECADLMVEGMTIAGYAIGAETGILYLRGEYAYILPHLEKVLQNHREKGLLGTKVCGKEDFSFDIRIQLGAGAYICGEETSLISSCEGTRGDPKNRPPFPAQKGYMGHPTAVNNVETFCCVARILDKGPGWFAQMGSHGSPGTKLLSVSGDCRSPGVYEVPFGITVQDLLKMVGAEDAAALQIGGPSGQMIGKADFGRTICYDDLATGGSIMVFGPDRDILAIVSNFMEFFVEESCGYCTPCRVGNVLLRNKIEEIRAGHGATTDTDYLLKLGETVKVTSRCGLGQTSPNPVLSTLKNFPQVYESLLKKPESDGFLASFDIVAALEEAKEVTGRDSVIYK